MEKKFGMKHYNFIVKNLIMPDGYIYHNVGYSSSFKLGYTFYDNISQYEHYSQGHYIVVEMSEPDGFDGAGIYKRLVIQEAVLEFAK